jgi:hypothetical protein
MRHDSSIHRMCPCWPSARSFSYVPKVCLVYFGPSTTQCCICSIVNNTTLVHYRLPCTDLKKNEIASGWKNGSLLYYHFSLFCTVCTVLWESVTDIGGSVECCPDRHPAVASMALCDPMAQCTALLQTVQQPQGLLMRITYMFYSQGSRPHTTLWLHRKTVTTQYFSY